jgi:hypothetical protein
MSNPSPQESWNSDIMIEVIAKELQYASPNNVEAITPGSPLASGVTNFSLLLSEAATVGFTPVGATGSISVALPAGYQPIRVSAVASVSAGSAYALY